MKEKSMKQLPIEPVSVSINMKKTGRRLKRLIKESGYTIHEIMTIAGITTAQTIYQWYYGRSLPKLETQIILSRLLGKQITDLLVLDRDPEAYHDRGYRLSVYYEYMENAA